MLPEYLVPRLKDSYWDVVEAALNNPNTPLIAIFENKYWTEAIIKEHSKATFNLERS